MVQIVFRNPWIRALGLLLALTVVGILMFLLSAVLIPLSLAFFVAYTFDPVVDMFERRGYPRMAGIAVLLILLFSILLAVPLFGIPAFIEETREFMQSSTDGEQDPLLSRIIEFFRIRTLLTAIDWMEPGDTTSDVREVIATKIGEFLSQLTLERLHTEGTRLQNAQSTVAGIFSSISGSVVGAILFVGNFVLFTFVSVYLLNDYDKIIAAGNELIPPRHRSTAARIMGKIDLQLRAFLRGQMIVCASLGVMYTIGFLLSGTKFAVALGIFGAMASFVPYLGLALTIGPAVLLTVLDYGIDLHLAGVLLTFMIAQFVEGNFLTPKIVGSKVGLGPVWVILAIMIFSSALGFTGLLLAVPIAACLKVLVEEAVAYYKTSAFFEGAAPPGTSTLAIAVVDGHTPDAKEELRERVTEESPPAKKSASPAKTRARSGGARRKKGA